MKIFIRSLLLSVCAFVALQTSSSAAGLNLKTSNERYANFAIGGMLPATGYGGADGMFGLSLEAGLQYFALPINFGFGSQPGSDYVLISFKPRVQNCFALFPQLPKLLIAPGIGPNLNYYAGDHFDQIELGINTVLQLRYKILPQLNITFQPLGLDFNFWRWADVEGAGSNSKAKFGLFYNILFGAGYNF